ncbi:MAG TPA: CAP domain-containing protein [Kofleriaceae bacterium]|nr:CAP domain-containing protein [Kofleriaceae bacterium]
MRAACVCVVLVLALAFACGGGTTGGGGGGGGGGVDAANGSATPLAYCVSQTNMYRATAGKPALTESSALEAYAATGAMYDFTNGPHAHFTATSGGGIAFAENECPVQGNWMLQPGGDMTALVGMCVQAFYNEGPGSDYSTHGHYINMMGPYTTLGCGIYQQGTGVTIVQDYGM